VLNMNSDIIGLLFKGYRYKVLKLLLLHPKEQYHVRAIARITHTVAGTLHKELIRLAKTGLLLKETSGNQVLYRANKEHFIFSELVSILKKTDRRKHLQTNNNAFLEKHREEILQFAKQSGIENVRVVGSIGQSGFALGGFLTDITELVNRKVDVVTEKSLHPAIREQVLSEAILL